MLPRLRTAAVAALVTTVGAVSGAPLVTGSTAAPAAGFERPPGATCYTADADLTVEEQRLGEPLPGRRVPAARQFVVAGGLDTMVDRFQRRLCRIGSLDAATAVAERTGARLWRRAVQRAQGERRMGRLDRYDDRPLYWARLTMTRALREWESDFEMSSLQRQALVRILGYGSRGIDSVGYAYAADRGEGDGRNRVLVSGFDTYSLDDSLRNSNPSGAAALQLDGRTVRTADGTAVIEAVMLPVNWSDFDQGIVEDAFGPWLTADDPVEMIMTISQTARGRMDIEQWAGNFRGGFPDNNRAIHYGPISAAGLWPQPQPSPQWIETTLPYQAMIAAGTEPWPVRLNDGICEWPRGTFPEPGAIRCQDDPSAGSRAAEAPGGNYLSNESMYRTNRLRIGAGVRELAGGHLHISALVYPDDPGALSSPAFVADRRAVVDQTVALVDAAGTAVEGR